MTSWTCLKCMKTHVSIEEIDECGKKFFEELKKLTPQKMLEIIDIVKTMPDIVESK